MVWNKVSYVVLWATTVFALPAAASQVVAEVRAIAKAEGISPDLLVAIVSVESGFNVNAVGSVGEIGLMQLKPKYHDASFNVRKNVTTGARYLLWLKERPECKSRGKAWFTCYQTGPNKKLENAEAYYYYLRVKAAKARMVAGE